MRHIPNRDYLESHIPGCCAETQSLQKSGTFWKSGETLGTVWETATMQGGDSGQEPWGAVTTGLDLDIVLLLTSFNY